MGNAFSSTTTGLLSVMQSARSCAYPLARHEKVWWGIGRPQGCSRCSHRLRRLTPLTPAVSSTSRAAIPFKLKYCTSAWKRHAAPMVRLRGDRHGGKMQNAGLAPAALPSKAWWRRASGVRGARG